MAGLNTRNFFSQKAKQNALFRHYYVMSQVKN